MGESVSPRPQRTARTFMVCLLDSRVDGGPPLCQSDCFTDQIIVEKSRHFCTWHYLSGVEGKLSRGGEWETVPDFRSTKTWVPGDLSEQLQLSVRGYHGGPRRDCILLA